MSRTEQRRQRYEIIKRITGDADIARRYRDASIRRVQSELNIDLQSFKKEKPTWTPSQWGEWSETKEFPEYVERLASQINREVRADEFSSYGYIVAFYQLIEGKTRKTINRIVRYSPVLEEEIYQRARRVARQTQ